ncbi:GlsB/YeaQ/YmgE family stress response membrane protein [Candidatus Gracilibacteria bacterium]|nr:GlsB/YeaQ/YmgE family stress response membrane protein [Candidatus Gracilibacteria bacterium]NJS41251.1 GlsB/YeaQ/YmgE family stress response membrane protein [Candidatus Gracilibacteria bacterium]
MNLLYSLIIGGIAGLLAGLIRKGEGFGFFGNIIVGLIGGFLGGVIFGALGVDGDGFIGNLIVSTIGAVVFLWLVGLFKK